MGYNVFEKRLAAVALQLFTANGTTDGTITIATDPATLFKVKQKVIVSATGLPDIIVEVKEIVGGLMKVGPLPSAARPATTNTASRPPVQNSILLRTDLSAYTVALGAGIYADEQKRTPIDSAEIARAVYEEEPAVAIRTILVDEDGDKYNISNPLPVNAEVTVDTIQFLNKEYDTGEVTYPLVTREIYTTYVGGYSGTPVQQVTINYTDSTKNTLLNWQRANWNGSAWVVS